MFETHVEEWIAGETPEVFQNTKTVDAPVQDEFDIACSAPRRVFCEGIFWNRIFRTFRAMVELLAFRGFRAMGNEKEKPHRCIFASTSIDYIILFGLNIGKLK